MNNQFLADGLTRAKFDDIERQLKSSARRNDVRQTGIDAPSRAIINVWFPTFFQSIASRLRGLRRPAVQSPKGNAIA